MSWIIPIRGPAINKMIGVYGVVALHSDYFWEGS